MARFVRAMHKNREKYRPIWGAPATSGLARLSSGCMRWCTGGIGRRTYWLNLACGSTCAGDGNCSAAQVVRNAERLQRSRFEGQSPQQMNSAQAECRHAQSRWFRFRHDRAYCLLGTLVRRKRVKDVLLMFSRCHLLSTLADHLEGRESVRLAESHLIKAKTVRIESCSSKGRPNSMLTSRLPAFQRNPIFARPRNGACDVRYWPLLLTS